MSVFLVGFLAESFAEMPRKGVGSLAAQSFILFRLRHLLSGRLTRINFLHSKPALHCRLHLTIEGAATF